MSVTFRLANDVYQELSINLSNRNAHDLLVILERPLSELHDCYGCWTKDDIEQILEKLKDAKIVEGYALATWKEGIFIHVGRDIEYCRSRFQEMTELLQKAIEKNSEVVFS